MTRPRRQRAVTGPQRPPQTTRRVRPARGIMLPGLPATGAHVPAALAAEWLANGLAVPDDDAQDRSG